MGSIPRPRTRGAGYGESICREGRTSYAGVVSSTRPARRRRFPSAGRSHVNRPTRSPSRVDAKVGRVAPPRPNSPHQGATWPGKTVAHTGIGLALVGGGGFYAYQNVDFESPGSAPTPAQERADRINAGRLDDKLMAGDERGHWDRRSPPASVCSRSTRGKPRPRQGSRAGADRGVPRRGFQPRGAQKGGRRFIGELVRSAPRGPMGMEKARPCASRPRRGARSGGQADAGCAVAAGQGRGFALYLGWAAQAVATEEGGSAMARASDPGAYAWVGRSSRSVRGDKARGDVRAGDRKQPDKKHIGRVGLVEIRPSPATRTARSALRHLREAPESADRPPPRSSRAWTLYGDEPSSGSASRSQQNATARRASSTRPTCPMGEARSPPSRCTKKAGQSQTRRGAADSTKPSSSSRACVRIPALVGLTGSTGRGEVVEARVTIEKAAKLDDRSAVAQLWLGRVLADTSINEINGRRRVPQRDATRASRLRGYVALAQLLGKRGTPRAPSSVLAPSPMRPRRIRLGQRWGWVHGRSRFRRRRGVVPHRARVDPDFAEARLKPGRYPRRAGRYADAIAEYQVLLKKEPNREDVSLRLGTTFERLRSSATREDLPEAPVDGRGTSRRSGRAGGGRSGRDRRSGSSSPSRKSSFRPGSAAADGLLLARGGRALAGKLDEASKDLTEAITVDPQAEYHEMWAAPRAEEGRGAAMGQYQAALAMDAHAPGARGARRMQLERHDWTMPRPRPGAAQLEVHDAALWRRRRVGRQEAAGRGDDAYNKSTDRDDKRGPCTSSSASSNQPTTAHGPSRTSRERSSSHRTPPGSPRPTARSRSATARVQPGKACDCLPPRRQARGTDRQVARRAEEAVPELRLGTGRRSGTPRPALCRGRAQDGILGTVRPGRRSAMPRSASGGRRNRPGSSGCTRQLSKPRQARARSTENAASPGRSSTSGSTAWSTRSRSASAGDRWR